MSGVADIVELQEERSKRTPLTENEFDTAGAMLRAAREARALSIEEVSEAINVRSDYLQAIENMAIDRLPIAAYTSGFVKAYTQFLELPVDALLARFRREAGYGASHIAPEVAIPTTKELTGGRELSLLAVVAIVAFIIWVAFQITRPPRDIGPVEISGTPLQERPIEEKEVSFTAENEVPVAAGTIAPTPAGDAASTATGATDTGSVETGSIETGSGETGTQSANTAPVEAENESVASDAPAQANAEATAEATAEANLDVPEIDYIPRPKVPAVEDSRQNEALAEEITQNPVTAAELNALALDDAQDATLTAAPATTIAAAPLEDQLFDELEASLTETTDALGTAETTTPSPQAPVIREPIITEAVTRTRVAPIYPKRCEPRADDNEAIVVIFDITSRGATSNARIKSSTNSCFNRAALSAIARWTFTPALRDGAPTPTYGRSTKFNFQLPE